MESCLHLEHQVPLQIIYISFAAWDPEDGEFSEQSPKAKGIYNKGLNLCAFKELEEISEVVVVNPIHKGQGYQLEITLPVTENNATAMMVWLEEVKKLDWQLLDKTKKTERTGMGYLKHKDVYMQPRY